MLLEEKQEQEIIIRAKENPECFAPLYDYYLPKIHNYIYHRVHNVQLAEDLVAETFYKALANIKRFEWQQRTFACWLYTIARNQVIDHFRKKTPVLVEASVLDGRAADDNPEEMVMQEITKEELLEAIKTLSPDQQDALLLRFQEELKIKEIAEILGRNEGAIKALLFRGLKSLRRKLESEGYR